ncbi:unnamed protein product [Anisakis simplex]|uniref:tRNA (adenine(58)-N(1))-methyltransferase non-catalytic subunit TRM6 n=2 Tax=Anisakis simplex TaxID=6269 RepID=A0A3P6SYD4_ANISI|nr:unnamed protein product [Anisakis simplex]
MKPNIRLIAESYYKKDPDRISNLRLFFAIYIEYLLMFFAFKIILINRSTVQLFRLDMLSQILLLSGLRSGSRCLVFEQCLGLLTAAIIERLGGEGACVHIHRGLIAQAIPCVQSMDFDEQTYSTFLPLRVATLLNGKVDEDEENAESSSSNMLKSIRHYFQSEASLARRMDRLRREKIAWQLISDQQIDCLFIAVKGVDPTDVLARTWHSLRLASTIVLYSPISEPLICAYNWLKENGAVHVQVCDSFQRSYQVLPESTHPVMQQLVAAGFILSAIKVQPPQSL